MAQTLTFSQLEQLWTQNGGNPAWAPTAAGVALAESGGNTQSANTSDPYGGSFGLWQINGVHNPQGNTASPSWIASMYDPNQNARQAIAVSNNGTNWGPWTGDPVGNVAKSSATPLTVQQIAAILTTSGRSLGGLTPNNNPGAAIQPAPVVNDAQANGMWAGHLLTDCMIPLPLGTCLVNYGQGRAVLGALTMVTGGFVMLLGLGIIVAFGLPRSSPVQKVAPTRLAATTVRKARAKRATTRTGEAREETAQRRHSERVELTERRTAARREADERRAKERRLAERRQRNARDRERAARMTEREHTASSRRYSTGAGAGRSRAEERF